MWLHSFKTVINNHNNLRNVAYKSSSTARDRAGKGSYFQFFFSLSLASGSEDEMASRTAKATPSAGEKGSTGVPSAEPSLTEANRATRDR